jgi:Fic family protein
VSAGEGGPIYGNDRSGYNVLQPSGFRAFIPKPLPPEPPLDLACLLQRLSQADRALGRLDGATSHILDADLFLAMYVRQEALLSSQIEGTDCTLDDLLAYEIEAAGAIPEVDVLEVVNYVAALRRGLELLKSLPISRRLLTDVHRVLLAEGRGSDRTPGEFRRTQSWIGATRRLEAATFVPPPPEEMERAFADLERFIDSTKDMHSQLPVLLVCGLVHAQFETVHPFLDGNGRMGRLLITLLLCEREALRAPVLYLSTYLRRHRTEYFDLLMRIRAHGSWEDWLTFFLTGLAETAEGAAATADAVHRLREEHRRILEGAGGTLNDLTLLDRLFGQPLVNAAWVIENVKVSQPTANAMLARFEAAGILRETTGFRRNRAYRYDAYLALFDQPIVDVTVEETQASV